MNRFVATIITTLLALHGARAAETTNAVEKITQQEVVEAALYGKADVVAKALEQG